MKMMYNIREVRGNNFLLWGVVRQQPIFWGAVVEMHGVRRGHGRSLLSRGKKSVNHLKSISLFEQMFMFIANLRPKDRIFVSVMIFLRKIVFSFRRIKDTAQSFLLTEKFCCYNTICPKTALILG